MVFDKREDGCFIFALNETELPVYMFDKQSALYRNNCRDWKRLLGVLWKWMLAVEVRLFSSMEMWQENSKSW